MSAGRVLLVDDQETTRYVQGTWLRRAGWEVDEAATGAEALALVGPEHDVVILDVHLPDMSGYDVCTAIKTNAETMALPVLHVSATATAPQDRTRGLNNGADGYLVEPLEVEEFLASVSALARYHASNRRTERLAARLSMLSIATLDINAAGSFTAVAGAAAKGAANTFETSVVVAVRTPEGLLIGHAGASGAYSISAHPLGVVLGDELQPMRFSAAEMRQRTPSLPAGEHDADWYVVPIVNRQARVGAVAVQTGPLWNSDDEVAVEQLASIIAVAVENLRLAGIAHELSLSLQRSLLPRSLPVTEGLELVARYQPSDRNAEVGGDFYDAFALPRGRLAIVIGDVQGHSLVAAAIMAELRYSLRALATEGQPIGHVMERLNLLMLEQHADTIATLCLVYVASDRATLEVANAGHPPPLLRTHDGTVTAVGTTSPLLGLRTAPAAVTEEALPLGASLLLFTDGLVERRGDDIMKGIGRVRDALATGGRPEAMLDTLLAMSIGHTDDIAMLLAKRTA